MIVVGVDPDSTAHGVAIYRDGQLAELRNMALMDINAWIEEVAAAREYELLFSIENVLANNFVYARNNQGSKAAQAKVGIGIGRCQQSQMELMRLLDHWEVSYVLHKPCRGNWAKDKERFERFTGWKGRSNEDCRSAAYFGFLGLRGMR